jgi:lysophospholipase L1-like esterase
MLSGGRDTKQVWSTKSQTVTLNSEITNAKIIYPETGEEMTVPEAAALKKPQYLVISLGTNGVATLTEAQFKYCYKKLINAVKEASPNTKIIVQSIYPVTSWYTGFSNEKINTANKWLLDIADETDVRYADTASVLKDKNGALKEAYNSDHNDGYHVNAEAYEKILHYLRTHGYQ